MRLQNKKEGARRLLHHDHSVAWRFLQRLIGWQLSELLGEWQSYSLACLPNKHVRNTLSQRLVPLQTATLRVACEKALRASRVHHVGWQHERSGTEAPLHQLPQEWLCHSLTRPNRREKNTPYRMRAFAYGAFSSSRVPLAVFLKRESGNSRGVALRRAKTLGDRPSLGTVLNTPARNKRGRMPTCHRLYKSGQPATTRRSRRVGNQATPRELL